MAWNLDPYATYTEYAQRNGRVGTADQSSIEEMLITVSRVVDRRCRVFDGMFQAQPDHTGPFIFPAHGGTRLYLRDEEGMQYLLRTVTANKIEIDDGDGTYGAYALDLEDAWVREYPVNASVVGRPYTALDLLPGVTGANPASWPASTTAVRITGTWGWATTPGAIKERVISITRELIDAHHAGASLSVGAMDATIQSVPSTRMLMGMLEREFTNRIPVF